MKMTTLMRRLGLKAMAAAALLALTSTTGVQAGDSPAPPWASTPTSPVAQLPAPELPVAEQPPAPVQLTPAPAKPIADPAMKALMLDTIKQYEADKKKAEDEKKKADEEKAKRDGVVVGDDRKLNVTWDNGGFRFKSADESFNLHIGGRVMGDGVWFRQEPQMERTATTPAALAGTTGIGPGIGKLEDGFFLRRLRVIMDGQYLQIFEFGTQFDLENYNSITYDEMYAGVRYLPIVDTVRVGHLQVPFGLESYTSSRWLPMMERSPLFDAFYNEFATGIFMQRNFLDQRMTTAHLFHRIDNFSQFNGDSFGDGKYAYSGRITALPIYEDDGRHLLHLGLDYQWRNGANPADFNGGTVLPAGAPPNAITSHTELFRFRTRQSIRDGIGLQTGDAGTGNGNRIVDTGNIIADHVNSVNPEMLFYWGPFWIQSEATWAHVSNAFFPATAAVTSRGDLDFWGAYVQVGYFLTGENRGYDRRKGTADRVVPLENFFLVKDECGRIQHGLGAWELVYRYSYLDLSDGSVQGGLYSEHTVGVNWYMTPNFKCQFNYLVGARYVPATPGVVAAGASNNSGVIQGIGLRAALEF